MHTGTQNKDNGRLDGDFKITVGSDIIPYQIFRGTKWHLYKNEKYFSKGRNRLHVHIWECAYGKKPKGFHVHHKDGDTTNNDINNLECIEGSKHLSMHMSTVDKDLLRQRMDYARGYASKWHQSDEGRAWHKIQNKAIWVNRPFTKHNCQQCGKEYETRKIGVTKFCHQNCKARALRERRKKDNASI